MLDQIKSELEQSIIILNKGIAFQATLLNKRMNEVVHVHQPIIGYVSVTLIILSSAFINIQSVFRKTKVR